jgi:hypothetical protein
VTRTAKVETKVETEVELETEETVAEKKVVAAKKVLSASPGFRKEARNPKELPTAAMKAE